MNRTQAPAVRPFGHLDVPAEHIEILSNGLTLHVIEGGDQPVSRLTVVFEGGAAELGHEIVSSLLVSQMIEGTSSLTGDEIADILDYNGARTGVRPQSHHSVADLWFLNTRAAELMPLWGDCLVNPAYPDRALETARRRLLSAYMASREEVSALADEAFTELMYGPGHPLGRPQTAELIQEISTAQLCELHRQILCPERMHAFLSGKYDENVIVCVRAMLESIPATGHGFSIDILPMCPPAEATRVSVHKENAFQDAVMAGLATPGREHPDYVPLRLTIMALGGYFGSRLMANIREEKGLTYGISASLLGCREGAYMAIAAQCDGRYTDMVLEETAAEMRRMVSEPPGGEELMRLKLHAATSLAEILDTPAAIAGYYANRIFVGTPADYFEQQQQAIDALTSDKIAEMAAKYLIPENLSVVIAGQNH